MAVVTLPPQRWTRQPQYPAPIDPRWASGLLTAGLNYIETGQGSLTENGAASSTQGVTALGLGRTIGSTAQLITANPVLPAGAQATVLVAFRADSLAANAGLFDTGGTATAYAGHFGGFLTTGAIQVGYGANTGTNTTVDRRVWITPSSAVATGGHYVMAWAVDSATVSRMWINGTPQTLTAGGTGGAYATPGTGRMRLGVRLVGSLTGTKTIAAWAFWDGALRDTDLRDLSINPWQLWQAPTRRIYILPAAGGTSTRTVTAAGGLDFGGTASQNRTIARTTTGGIDLGGTSAQLRYAARVASGGMDLGGIAPALRYRVSTGSGGIDLGGTAPAVGFRGITVEADGGMAFGGEVVPLRYRTVSGDGGIAFGGTAPVSFVGTTTTVTIRVIVPGGGTRSYTFS